MGSVKNIILSAVTIALMGSAASAATYVLDFDADPNNAAEVASLDSSATQTIASPRIFTDSGVSWSVESSGGAGVGLFDTTCSYGFGTNGCSNDPDLQVFDQNNADGVSGNVLIQQETGNLGRPDDDANTSFLTLTLLTDITLEWTGASAVDDGYYLFNFGNLLLGTVDNGNGSTFDNTTGSVDFSSTALLNQNDTITVFFQRSPTDTRGASGALDNFRFNVVPAVPVPASLPLLAGGIGLMAFMRRRRKT